MKFILNKRGLTLVEIIMTFAVLGVVICPLMTMFITSHKICNFSEKEYKSMLLAQKYIEEIVSMERINTYDYPYNSENGYYERNILHENSTYTTKIRIIPAGSMLYYIKVDVSDDFGIVNKLESSKIFY